MNDSLLRTGVGRIAEQTAELNLNATGITSGLRATMHQEMLTPDAASFTDMLNPTKSTDILNSTNSRQSTVTENALDAKTRTTLDQLERIADRLAQPPQRGEVGREQVREAIERLREHPEILTDRGLNGKTFLENLNRIAGTAQLSASQKAQLIGAILVQTDPFTVNQGYKNTCPVTCLEFDLVAQAPGEYARILADAVTRAPVNGQIRVELRGLDGKGGDFVSFSEGDIAELFDSSLEKGGKYPARTVAERLFQNTMMNAVGEYDNRSDKTSGQPYGYSFAGLHDREIQQIYERTLGKRLTRLDLWDQQVGKEIDLAAARDEAIERMRQGTTTDFNVAAARAGTLGRGDLEHTIPISVRFNANGPHSFHILNTLGFARDGGIEYAYVRNPWGNGPTPDNSMYELVNREQGIYRIRTQDLAATLRFALVEQRAGDPDTRQQNAQYESEQGIPDGATHISFGEGGVLGTVEQNLEPDTGGTYDSEISGPAYDRAQDLRINDGPMRALFGSGTKEEADPLFDGPREEKKRGEDTDRGFLFGTPE